MKVQSGLIMTLDFYSYGDEYLVFVKGGGLLYHLRVCSLSRTVAFGVSLFLSDVALLRLAIFFFNILLTCIPA